MGAVESVRRQTYANWEIVLVDDGCTDNSEEVYVELEKDERIHIYCNDKNMGCGYTKHRCAELAKGEICGFLDPDDALIENTLELETKIHVAHPEVSIIYSKPLYCDSSFNVLENGEVPVFKAGETYLDHRTHGAMNFASYKNEYYKKTQGINPKLKAGVDQDLYFRMEEVGQFYVLDEYTYKYVIVGHPNAISCGVDKEASLWYWNLVARRDAFIRRGRSEEELVEDLKAYVDKYTRHMMRQQELHIRSSYAYRVGKFLTTPLSWLKRKL